MEKKIVKAAEYIKSQGIDTVETAIILGTGLGTMVKHIEVDREIPYKEIPHFPESTVEFHSGKLIYGKLEGKQVLVMNGRFHFYEGYSLQEVTFPIRVMKLLGVKNLFVSNAAGAINLALKPASLMIIDDHINMLPGNPLVGRNLDSFGPRFPDMSRPYDPEFIEKLETIAGEEGIEVARGVYIAWIGPSLETRAEYRLIKVMGADVVGMSTVPEVIVAVHQGMRVAAVSVVTDICDPDNLEPIVIEKILTNAAVAEKNLVKLFRRLVADV
ncbi:MAG: purine-nucleoside phosphorylase [Bacteroidetes bacterium]|nr:MAG: purine-nucleoside phosphorylase [Bacteroidota bacterium]